MIYIIPLVSSIFCSLVILPGIIDFINSQSNHAKNYRGGTVSNSAGILFIIYILIASAALELAAMMKYDYRSLKASILVICTGTLSAALAGHIDDGFADGRKGIRQHIGAALNGKVTSGFLKAMFCILISFTICAFSGFRGISLILNVVLLCLSQNFFNMMDLRPGRAIKVYGVFFLFLLILRADAFYLGVNSGFMLLLLFYVPYEFKEICIMGDTGSNTIGMLAGLSLISSDNIIIKTVILLLLLLIEFYGDRKSISALIEKSSILKYIDRLGRKV
ncbi:MAG: hypothetical protein QME45_05550 [Clostridiales bacterium]|nr:hypothetical protein [Clostridiales bacterium]